MNDASTEPREFNEQELAGFKAVAEFLAPTAIYEIAREIVHSSCAESSKSAVIEVCFDIERTNNGAAEFLAAMVK